MMKFNFMYFIHFHKRTEKEKKKENERERIAHNTSIKWGYKKEKACHAMMIKFFSSFLKKAKIYKKNFYLPFGKTLFFLDHVTFGVGLPEAEHSILTEPPFLTCRCAPELM